jgi:hypothetical protein
MRLTFGENRSRLEGGYSVRKSEVGSKTQSSNFFSEMAFQILVIQLSAATAISLKAVSSESSGEIFGFGTDWWGIWWPCTIPIFVWFFAAVIRERDAHLVRIFMTISSVIFFLGFVSFIFFLEQDDGGNVAIFLLSYFLIISSASLSLVFISENFEDPRYNWVGITDLLTEGGDEEDVLAMVPVTESGSLSFKTSSGIRRASVEPSWSSKEVMAVDSLLRMRQMGFLIKRRKYDLGGKEVSSYWGPATIEAMSEKRGGFNFITGKKVEEQSLVSILMAILSSGERKWTEFGPGNLMATSSGMESILGNPDEVKVIHTWTPTDLSRTALQILSTISSVDAKRSFGIEENNRKKGPKKIGNYYDYDGDGEISFREKLRTWKSQLDLNDNEKLDIGDVIVGLGLIIVAIFGRKEYKDQEDVYQKIVSAMIDEGGVDGGGSQEINKHLTMGYIVCLSSLSQSAFSISEISWREASFFYAEMAIRIQMHIDKHQDDLGDEKVNSGAFRESLFDNIDRMTKLLLETLHAPVRKFANYYDEIMDLTEDTPEMGVLLFETTKNMIDRIDVEKFGTPSAELLERRKGTIVGASMALVAYRNYLDSLSGA